jgi:hypothetical protein
MEAKEVRATPTVPCKNHLTDKIITIFIKAKKQGNK